MQQTHLGRMAFLTVALFAGLGCAGLFEGEQVEEPLLLEGPDGTVQTITRGSAAEVPEGFPLPVPVGRDPDSAIESEGRTTLTFELVSEEEAQAQVERYTHWFSEHQADPEVQKQNLAGMRTTVLVGEVGEQRLTVTILDGMGARLLTLTAEPR